MIDILSDLLNLDIENVNLEKSIKLNSILEYEFWAHKGNIILKDGKKVETFFKFIEKDKIKESLYCYWNLILEQTENINKKAKVSIIEQQRQIYIDTIYLEVKNKNDELPKCKTKVYLIDIQKYIKDCLKDIEHDIGKNQKLFIGIIE